MYPPSMVAAACISTAILGLSTQATSNNGGEQQKQVHNNWHSQSQLQVRLNEITGIEAVRWFFQCMPLVSLSFLSFNLLLREWFEWFSLMHILSVRPSSDWRETGSLRQETGNGCWCRMSRSNKLLFHVQLIAASLIGRGIYLEIFGPAPRRKWAAPHHCIHPLSCHTFPLETLLLSISCLSLFSIFSLSPLSLFSLFSLLFFNKCYWELNECLEASFVCEFNKLISLSCFLFLFHRIVFESVRNRSRQW